MAWIEGELSRTFDVNAPFDKVVSFFRDPAIFQQAFGQMESGELVEENVWKWVLEEKNEKGIKYQANYTVSYTPSDDGVSWETVEGNMKTEGHVSVVSKSNGEAAEVTYKETLSPDLPIPKLAAKVFRPIVAKEVSRGIGDFLDRAKAILEED